MKGCLRVGPSQLYMRVKENYNQCTLTHIPMVSIASPSPSCSATHISMHFEHTCSVTYEQGNVRIHHDYREGALNLLEEMNKRHTKYITREC